MSPTANDPDSTAVTLDRVYRFDPATGFPPEVASRVLGGQACLWTEFIETEEQAERMLMPRLLAMSDALWATGERSDFTDFAKRVLTWLKRFETSTGDPPQGHPLTHRS